MRIRLSSRVLMTSAVVLFAITLAIAWSAASAAQLNRSQASAFDGVIEQHARDSFVRGRETFRFDTFGSEAFWGGRLRLHQPIIGARFGGVGPGLSPLAALQVGLKVDVEMVPTSLLARLRAGSVDLNDPAITLELVAARAVLGVTAFTQGTQVTGIGFQCALCHSNVDDSVIPGVGRRLDGWPNRDLNVGAIIALAPDLTPFTQLLQLDDATVRRVLNSWGPGKFDAELILDGKAIRPDGRSAATLMPAAFGLSGVNAHTYTGNWGTVTYWNAFVANLEMHGSGRFYDPRLANAAKYPVAARAGLADVFPTGPDLITSKLPDLHFYQLAIPAPQPPDGSFNRIAAERGQIVFNSVAGCARCHVPPLFTEPGWGMHTAEEIGIDNFQASRSPDNRYRTTPLKGAWSRAKGGYYHDGRFANLRAVVEHYDRVFSLRLSEAEMNDLVEYLKSL
jgi:mono/diheme cytochrome c family protein